MRLEATDFSLYPQPKVDCHCHVLDPLGFPYASDVGYRPAGQETGSAHYFAQVLEAYGAQHALLVGPNSGYGTDNRALLSAIATGQGRFKGIAVVRRDASTAQLQDLQAQGVVGIAFNPSLHGLDYYADAGPLWGRLAALGMFVQVQADRDQWCALAPRMAACGAPLLIDHCGRPPLGKGLQGESFAALLGLARTGRATVKLSGYAKFSMEAFPFNDTAAHVHALLEAFGPAQCIWASDWPFLKAPSRLDYGSLLQLFGRTVPDAQTRRAILWDTPLRLFGLGTP